MLLLSAITFTTPLLLWGMAGVALPLIAHLFNRRVRRRVVFPTVKLLLEAAASRSRVFRLRRLILLILRCTAVALLAWAFARPVWTDASAANGAAGGAAVVLVVDVSASTAQREGGVPLVTRIAGEAERQLSGLEAGRDVAGLVFAGIKPRAGFPRLVANFDSLREELRDLTATQERADFPAAIALAQSMLQDHRESRRIVVISDMQRSNWEESAGFLRGLRDGASIAVIPVGEGTAANTAIAQAAIQPARPTAGQPAGISAVVTNFADRRREVRINTTVDGREIGVRQLTLDPGASQTVSFDAVFDGAGMHRVVLSAADDDLALDDEVFLTAEPMRQAKVLIVGDDDPSQPVGASYFIHRALAPSGQESDPFEAIHATSGQITAQALRGVEAVVIGDIHGLTDVTAKPLVEYVASGGGIVMFLGEGPVSANAASLQHHATTPPLIPFQPLQPVKADRERPAWYFGEGVWSSPTLRSFDETARLALGQLPITLTHASGETSPGASVILRFTDGTPAIASLAHGRGKLVLANFTPAPYGGDLAKHGAFVALLHGMVDEVRPQSNARSTITVGKPLVFSLPATDAATPRNITVVDPTDKELRATVLTSENTAPAVQTVPTVRAGFHTLIEDDRPSAIQAVNIDERESDLRRVDSRTLSSTLPATVVVSATEGGPPPPSLDTAAPLWPWFLTAAAAALGVEMILLSLWRR